MTNNIVIALIVVLFVLCVAILCWRKGLRGAVRAWPFWTLPAAFTIFASLAITYQATTLLRVGIGIFFGLCLLVGNRGKATSRD